jgi:hypothetical protein
MPGGLAECALARRDAATCPPARLGRPAGPGCGLLRGSVHAGSSVVWREAEMDIATLGAAQLHCRYAGCERHGKVESDQLPGTARPP